MRQAVFVKAVELVIPETKPEDIILCDVCGCEYGRILKNCPNCGKEKREASS